MDYEYKRKNCYKEADEKELKAIFDYAEGYKQFLYTSKTERGATATAEKLAAARGYKPFTFGGKIKAGDKLYFINRDKNIFIIRVGTKDVAKHGVKIMAAHVDSPRLDLKPNPVFEDGGMAYLKTHYYGGIKKYQWTTIPLALHGVVMLHGGKRVDVVFPLFAAHTLADKRIVRHLRGKPFVLAYDGNCRFSFQPFDKYPRFFRLHGFGSVEVDGQTAHDKRRALFRSNFHNRVHVLRKALPEIGEGRQSVGVERVRHRHAYALVAYIERNVSFHMQSITQNFFYCNKKILPRKTARQYSGFYP